jgi:uncharacterized protein
VTWYRLAAEQNHAEAQCHLGVCYQLGNGVAKDHIEAYKWWLLVDAQGDEMAKQYRRGLEKELTPEQIAEAQKLAREWLDKQNASGGKR